MDNVLKILDLSDFIDSGGNALVYLNSVEQIIKMQPSLTSKQIKSLLCGMFFFENIDKNTDYETYYDKVLNLYDDCLVSDDKILILLKIRLSSLFEKYALEHYNLFKIFFETTVFINKSEINKSNELKVLYYKHQNKNYKLEEVWFNPDVLVSIYELFGSEIKFLDVANEKIIKYDTNLLCDLSFHQLIEILSNGLQMHIEQKEFDAILKIISNKYDGNEDSFTEIQKIYDSYDNQEELEKVVRLFQNYLKNNKNTDLNIDSLYVDKFHSQLYNKILRNRTQNMNSNINDPNDMYSSNYLNSLNQLEKLSSHERKTSSLYLKCFQTFLQNFLVGFQDEINQKELDMIESLFQRIINRKNIFAIMKIDNKKSLCHYYKTDELILKISLSYEDIQKYNAKHYLELKKLYQNLINHSSSTLINNSNVGHSLKLKCYCHNDINRDIDIDILFAINLLGYELTKKMIYKIPNQLHLVINHLKNKSNDYAKKMVTLLMDASDLESKYPISKIIASFDVMYEQNDKKVTFMEIKKCIDSVYYALYPNNYHIAKNLDKLNLVAKGEPLIEKLEAIKLYNDYRFRIVSSIPDIDGKINECVFTMVNLHSPEILSNGIGKFVYPNNVTASSCLTPNGKASSCLKHGAMNPNGRFFKVTYCDEIIAYSWVWRCGEVLCFDNIEVTKNLFKLSNYENLIYSIYQYAAKSIMHITSKEEKGGIKIVIIGRNKIDVKNSFIDNLPKVNDYTENLFKPNCFESLYLKDSSETQVILLGEYRQDIVTEDVKPLYKYLRKQSKRFSECDNDYLRERMNAIYFDYCLKNNKKYLPLCEHYIDGYLNEDYFIGFKNSDTFDFYYCGQDDRLFEDAKKIIGKKAIEKPSSPYIITPTKEQIKKILNIQNIEANIEEINRYLHHCYKSHFELNNQDYTHSPHSVYTLAKIFESHAITSSEYGNRERGGLWNGNHFISVAKVNTTIYQRYLSSGTLILAEDICAFSQPMLNDISDIFTNSSYPFRIVPTDGEYQVLESISLDRVKGIFVSSMDIHQLIQITYLEDLFKLDLPLVLMEDQSIIDKNTVKKYSKIR